MRYIPNTGNCTDEMLQQIGVNSIDELFDSIPNEIKLDNLLNVSAPQSEFELLNNLKKLSAETNPNTISFLGAGCYRRFLPSAINAITSRSEFLTSYTPYQPEVSQGTLQVMYEFQTLLAQLTGMDLANSSMYEGASATAEAVLMACRIQKNKQKVLLSAGLHPEYLETVKTYLKHKDLELVIIPLDETGRTSLETLKQELDENTICSVLQMVNFYGVIEDYRELGKILNDSPALNIIALAEMSSLGFLEPPGRFGADIFAGEGQSIGLPTSFGGPNLGILATSQKYIRHIPGRLAGKTLDADGRTAFCLTLATREQHIRREKATSNICSNQMLCGLAISIYLSLLGKQGLMKLARLNFDRSQYAIREMAKIEGVNLRYSAPVYNEFVIETKLPASELIEKFREKNIMPGVPLSRFNQEDQNGLLVSVTEVNPKEEIDLLIKELREIVK